MIPVFSFCYSYLVTFSSFCGLVYNSAEIHCWFPLKNQGLAISCLECLRTQALEPWASCSLSLCCGFYSLSFQSSSPLRVLQHWVKGCGRNPRLYKRASQKAAVRQEVESVGSVARCQSPDTGTDPLLLGWPSPLLFPPESSNPWPSLLPRGRGWWGGPDWSICDLGGRRVTERPAGLAGNWDLELLRSGEGWEGGAGGRRGERGSGDGVSEEMKVVYARSGCLDRPEWRAGHGGSAQGSRLIDHLSESRRP